MKGFLCDIIRKLKNKHNTTTHQTAAVSVGGPAKSSTEAVFCFYEQLLFCFNYFLIIDDNYTISTKV